MCGVEGRRVMCAKGRRGPREKNHILNQIKAMFVQVRAAVNQINNHMYKQVHDMNMILT